MKSIFFSVLFLTFALTGCGQTIKERGYEVVSSAPKVVAIGDNAKTNRVLVKDKYLIEKSIVGYWEVHTVAVVTPELMAHVKKQDGVERVYSEDRYQMTVHIGKMYEDKAALILTTAMDCFAEKE